MSARAAADVGELAPVEYPTTLDLAGFARALAAPVVPAAESWEVVVFRVRHHESGPLRELCDLNGLTIVDTLDRQLADLAVIRFPQAGREHEREEFVTAERSPSGESWAAGHWVWFPWLSQVVLALDPDDYFELITDRNRDKITRDEQRLLRTKRVGVMGLSVGGEAAVSIAQEHLCGHMVLADFDRLDLSNLNRLNAGVDELGVLKTTIVARRIARINPYLRVTVFHEGVTPENLDAFLSGLDLLVEECDGLALKFDVRNEARARGINIAFAADERGFLSVEPYATHPELPAFHGLVKERPLPRSGYATAADFMRALTDWLGGWNLISERSRESLRGIGITHSGYPQLASEARLAAGQLGHVCRRLLLGEPLFPFYSHLDLDKILPKQRVIR